VLHSTPFHSEEWTSGSGEIRSEGGTVQSFVNYIGGKKKRGIRQTQSTARIIQEEEGGVWPEWGGGFFWGGKGLLPRRHKRFNRCPSGPRGGGDKRRQRTSRSPLRKKGKGSGTPRYSTYYRMEEGESSSCRGSAGRSLRGEKRGERKRVLRREEKGEGA